MSESVFFYMVVKVRGRSRDPLYWDTYGDPVPTVEEAEMLLEEAKRHHPWVGWTIEKGVLPGDGDFELPDIEF